MVLTEYPDSQHGFDSGLFGFNLSLVSANAQTVRHCHIREGEGGLLVNADTQAPFSYKDDCVELSPHVGGELPPPPEEARKAVVEFLQALFKLGCVPERLPRCSSPRHAALDPGIHVGQDACRMAKMSPRRGLRRKRVSR